jgi:hypothetical protein
MHITFCHGLHRKCCSPVAVYGLLYSADETDMHTLQALNKIIAAKGKTQLGSITSSECGTLVTECCSMNE